MGLFDRIKRAIARDPAVAAADATSPQATGASAQDATSSRTALTGAASARGANASDTLQAIVSYLVETSESRLRVTDIDTDVDIFEYGYVDSLRVTKLFEFVEQRWGVVVPEAEIVGRLNTLKALAEFIDA